MLKSILLAICFIAVSAIPLWATGQNVYKCGSSYSQTPCTNGQLLNVDDARAPAQQQQTTEATHAAQKMAKQLEKDRLAQEKLATLNARQAAKQVATPSPTTATTAADAPLTRITPKSAGPKTKKPNQFIAEVPGSEKAATVKKTTKKKKSASAT